MKILVEQCQKININELVKNIKSEMFNIQIQSSIKTLNQTLNVATTRCFFGGERFWFICPDCKKKGWSAL